VASLRIRQRKDGSVYTSVRYRLNGTQSSSSFNDHAEAVAFCNLANQVGPAKAIEVWRTNAALGAGVGMTVAVWVAHHIDHLTGVEPRTIDDYRRYLRRDIAPTPLGALPLSAVTRDDVARWLHKLAEPSKAGKKPSAKTIHNKHGFLAGALNAAVTAGQISTNPCAGVRLPRDEHTEMVFLSREQFAELLGAVTEYWRPLVEFLVASGARWGEVTALQPADVDRDAGTVRIARAWKHRGGGYRIGPPKTRKSRRTINVPTSVLGKLDYSHEWLFVNRRGTPVRGIGFGRRVWAPAVERAGLDPAPRIHDLRHTCVSWMIAAGVPLPVIQAHLGHESIETTVGVYGHLDRSSAAAAAEAIAKNLDW
jgi:integrase